MTKRSSTLALAMILCGAAIARAQITTPVSISFTGNGMGSLDGLSGSGTGTLSPFGAASISISGGGGAGALTVGFAITLSDGDTLSASGSASSAARVISGVANITGGSGVFANPSGSITYSLAVPLGTTAGQVQFTLTGSGNVVTPNPTTTGGGCVGGVTTTAAVDSFVNFNLCGTVPQGASFGLLAMRANDECPSCLTGNIDVSLAFLSYTEADGKNRAPDPDFNNGAQSCALSAPALAELTVEPGSSNGHQLHFSGAAPVDLNCQLPGRFAVTPGATYNATFRARVTPASTGKGYFTVIFVSCSDIQNSCPVSRDFAPFQSTINGIALSQTGFTIQGVAGGSSPPPVKLSVLNGATTPFNFKVTVSTINGGTWLTATPASGITDPSQPAPAITIAANPGSLAAGTYYGQVQVGAAGAPNSPQVASVVLNLATPAANTAPVVQPTGLIFTSAPGTVDPPAQSVTLTELLNSGEAFSANATFAGSSSSWFTTSPASGSVQPNQPVAIAVQPHVSGLASGTYRGTLNFMFPRESVTRSVDLLLVVGAGLTTPALELSPRHLEPRASPICTPTQLLPVFTLLGSNFTVPASWPSAIEVTVVDDCGSPLRGGTVVTTFSNDDPALDLLPLGDGSWTGTWAPVNAVTPALKVTAQARSSDLKLQGQAILSGTLNANPAVPVVYASGVVNAGSFALTASPSPGELVSIFGANLSDKLDGAQRLPLQTQIDGVSVILGQRPLPLLLVAAGQINAVLPFDVAPGATQIVVTKNNQLSVPQTVQVQAAEPGAFTTKESGQGQALVYVVAPSGAETLADLNHPAKAGDALVIYCSGLGPVQPPLDAGQATPSTMLYSTVTQAAVTIGGQAAKVLFSGLTPGFTGLYQINAVVPAGITPGNSTPLVISVAGFGGPTVSMAVEANSN